MTRTCLRPTLLRDCARYQMPSYHWRTNMPIFKSNCTTWTNNCLPQCTFHLWIRVCVTMQCCTWWWKSAEYLGPRSDVPFFSALKSTGLLRFPSKRSLTQSKSRSRWNRKFWTKINKINSLTTWDNKRMMRQPLRYSTRISLTLRRNLTNLHSNSLPNHQSW